MFITAVISPERSSEDDSFGAVIPAVASSREFIQPGASGERSSLKGAIPGVDSFQKQRRRQVRREKDDARRRATEALTAELCVPRHSGGSFGGVHRAMARSKGCSFQR